jgi:undecaprenyl-phosphate 4-deoxy-4-formamido-L-arabinose transferase
VKEIQNIPLDILSGISVVVPVYNSENILPSLLARLHPVLKASAQRYEVILINDGSRDGSWSAIQRLCERYSWLIGIDLMRNYGQHNALLCGIRAAKHEVIVTIDDDLQNPPEEIPKLLSKQSEGFDVVYGTSHKKQHGFWRDSASQITKLVLQGSMGAEVARNISTFRAFRTQLRDAFGAYQGPYVSVDVLLTWATTRFATVPVLHNHRAEGVSNYSFYKLVTHALTMMTGFSVLPLQLASLIGLMFTLVGVGILVYVVGSHMIQGGSVPGFPFLASIIAIFSGLQLFALGIIGEYLARMHFRSMGRPPSVIRTVIGAAIGDN